MNDILKWVAFASFVTFAAGPLAAQNAPDASAGLMVPLPAPVPVKEALATLPDARLWYWDTGGDGTPVVLVHPATGSALIWGHQQPAFARAGYRVIGYSRRSYYGSDPLSKESPGVASEDLHDLIEFLGIRKFHAVGSAAGGGVAADYAVSHPDRLLSLVINSNPAGLSGGNIMKTY
jgi:pimeloyl-ACP methyl ester carboxylesterase